MILIKRRLPVNPGRWSVSAHRRVAHVSHTLVSTLRVGADASRQGRGPQPRSGRCPASSNKASPTRGPQAVWGRRREAQGEADANLHPGCTPEPRALRRGRAPSRALPGGSDPGQGSRETQGGE